MSGRTAQQVETLQSWHDDWSGLNVAVLGLGVTGFSVADTLQELGCRVHVIYGNPDPERERILDVLGVQRFQSPDDEAQLAELTRIEPDLLIVSPGYRPDHPLTTYADNSGIPVWGDIQLAWRLRDKTDRIADWICVTGTNGKTTTSQLTAHMLVAGGVKAAPVGNIGTPVLDAIRDPEGFDALVVELSSFQLHRLGNISPYAAVVLNIADDHLDWHGGREAYEQAKGHVYENVQVACVYNRADRVTEELVEQADVIEGARAISFGLDTPPPSGLGVIENLLIDRSFHAERFTSALELLSLEELEANALRAPHLIEDVLAAAALARSYGVAPEDIAAAVLDFHPDSHRLQFLLEREGVRWVDDSKATNTHAAHASLRSFPTVVWIVGGLLKGAELNELVVAHHERLRAAIVVGERQDEVVAALRRHAPEVPIQLVTHGEPENVMNEAVTYAKSLAQPGDTVLLSPAAASMDQFTSYEHRGQVFQNAVHKIIERGDETNGSADPGTVTQTSD